MLRRNVAPASPSLGRCGKLRLTLEKLLVPPQTIMSFGYCERASQAFWAEPMNALSNGAFILAAIAGLLLYRRRGGATGRLPR